MVWPKINVCLFSYVIYRYAVRIIFFLRKTVKVIMYEAFHVLGQGFVNKRINHVIFYNPNSHHEK